MSDSLQPHGLQHARLLCPSLSISKSLLRFISIESVMLPSHLILCCPLLLPSIFPITGSFPVSQLFASGGQSIGISTSVLPMSIQGWFPLGLTGLISLKSKGFSRVFSSTTIWKSQFFNAQPKKWHVKTYFHFYDITSPQENVICLVFSIWNNGLTQLPRPRILTFFCSLFMSASKSQNRCSLNSCSTSDWKTCRESFLNILKTSVNTQKLKVQ